MPETKLQSSRKLHPITGCKVESLLGDWLIDAAKLEQLRRQAAIYDLVQLVSLQKEQDPDDVPEPYEFMAQFPGVVMLHISGTTTKYPTSFRSVMGGGSTVETIKALRTAAQDDAVKAVMLHFEDCPGGTAAGCVEMVNAIRKANAIKPIFTHADDMACSCGQMYAAQGFRATANPSCLLGSIGAVSQLVDSSKAARAEGYEVIPIASGTMKAVGMPGVPVTKEQIAYRKALNQKYADLFVESMRTSPRKISEASLTQLSATAEAVFADDALKHGLIDAICSFEEAMAFASNFKGSPAETRTSAGGPKLLRSPEKVGNPPTRSTAMPLTAAQLSEARKLPGGSGITEENAADLLFSVAQEQNSRLAASVAACNSANLEIAELQKKVPAPVNAALAFGQANLELGHLSLMVKGGQLLPAQLDAIKPHLLSGEKEAKLGAVQPDGTVMVPMVAVRSVLEMNKPNGLLKDVSGAQPAVRTEPGAADPKAATKPTYAQYNETRVKYALPVATMEEYNTAMAGLGYA